MRADFLGTGQWMTAGRSAVLTYSCTLVTCTEVQLRYGVVVPIGVLGTGMERTDCDVSGARSGRRRDRPPAKS
jgi:hypothetical protein